MIYYFSKSSHGFYTDLHIERPEDCVEITEKDYKDLLEGQNNGYRIIANELGYPILSEQPQPSLEIRQLNAINQRRAAYQERSDPLFMKWQRGEGTKEEWLSMVELIKTEIPYPIE